MIRKATDMEGIATEIGKALPVGQVKDGRLVASLALAETWGRMLDELELAVRQGELLYLPPYSPHLNPDERARGHVQRQVSKRAPGAGRVSAISTTAEPRQVVLSPTRVRVRTCLVLVFGKLFNYAQLEA